MKSIHALAYFLSGATTCGSGALAAQAIARGDLLEGSVLAFMSYMMCDNASGLYSGKGPYYLRGFQKLIDASGLLINNVRKFFD